MAIVAGGGRGIGAATSERLAAAGARVLVVDKAVDRAQSTAARIGAGGGTAISFAADLLRPSEASGIVDAALASFGRVDVLANVAGGAWAYVPSRRLHDVLDQEWDLMLNLNLRYVFSLCREVIRHMLDAGQGGSIVNVGSFAGLFSSPNSAPYGAAKAGLVSLSRTIAYEYASDGIRVNCVAPGRIETPATPSESFAASGNGVYEETIPMGHVGAPLDIANAVVFFASELSRYVTGQTLLVDGGASSSPVIIPNSSSQLVPTGEVRGIP